MTQINSNMSLEKYFTIEKELSIGQKVPVGKFLVFPFFKYSDLIRIKPEYFDDRYSTNQQIAPSFIISKDGECLRIPWKNWPEIANCFHANAELFTNPTSKIVIWRENETNIKFLVNE